jgi:peptide/nickel transport system ATP-binding protein/oligopeptide transport system ATP-binding protein
VSGSPTQAVIEIRDLTTSFLGEGGRVPVVDEVAFHIEAGEVLALVGESGCGKSMTALSILRLVPKPGRIDAGEVLLAGRDIRRLPVPAMRQIRGQEISMIFQEPMTSLNPVATVGAQVVEAIRLHERVSNAEARRRTVDLFHRVGIPDPEARLDAYPHQLSGGLKQRVMIAMALSTRPRLLIADEPTTALDVTIQAQILQLLRDLQQEFGMSILLITHDLGIVNELADRVAVMYAGRIIEEGTRIDILGEARHPYTRGLLLSLPALASRGQRLAEIPGVVPPPDQWPPGCRFSTRCSRVFEPCTGCVPEVSEISGTHRSWCHAVAREIEP